MPNALHNPPFRADQVGSLLRPAHLIEARAQMKKKLLSVTELTKIEDAGTSVLRMTPAAFRAYRVADMNKWERVVKEGGIKAQ